jgi:inhibitor of cysteine peptidase
LAIFIFVTISLCLVGCSGDGASQQCEANAYVDSVEVVAADGDYHVVVHGHYPDACTTTEDIRQEIEGQTIKVTICTTKPEDAVCAQMLTPFEETVALDVEGLSPGQYTVQVDGTVNTLTLTESQ